MVQMDIWNTQLCYLIGSAHCGWWLQLNILFPFSLCLSVSLFLQSCRGRAALRPSVTARARPAAASHATSRATAPPCPPTRASHSASSPPTSPRVPPLLQEEPAPSSPPAPPACLHHICLPSIPLAHWCQTKSSLGFVFLCRVLLVFFSSLTAVHKSVWSQLHKVLVFYFLGWIWRLIFFIKLPMQL